MPGAVIVTGAGAGGGPHVEVWSEDADDPIGSFYAYAANFTGGVSVAVGDVDGDGHDDVVTAAGPGGGPHVKIFSGAPANGGHPFPEIGGFYAYDPNFHGGVDVAVADVNGDSKMDIITGAGPGGGPHVKVFDGAHVLGATPTLALLGQFMAYDPNFHGGVSVAGADMGGDSTAEVVTGAGPGGGPHIRVTEADGAVVGQFMAFDPRFTGGTNVAANCANGVARIAVGTATGETGFATYSLSSGLIDQGFGEDPADPKLQGMDVALGSIFVGNPPVQVITAFSGGGQDGDPQILVNPYPTSNDPLDGFDAYNALIRISVAAGRV